MIEVMVTIVVVAFGLLGLASLVLKGLQSGATSQTRTIAVSQTYDIVERMRGNLGNVSGFNATSSDCGALLAKIAAKETPIVSTLASAPACTTTDTSAAGLIACWQNRNFNALPGGAGAVCKSTTAGERWYAVIVSWDEGRTGTNNKSFWAIVEP